MFFLGKLKKYIRNEKYIFLFDMFFIGIGIIILIHRVFYGIDFTDQSWYVAEPYVVSEGAVPYADNWSQAPGFTIPLALSIKLYTFFNGSTEGIFLFSRIEYVIWLAIIGGITFFFLKKNNKIPIISLLPFFFITPGQSFAINYNTIGLVYLFLTCSILFFNDTASDARNEFVSGAVSGLIIARAIIGTPYIILPCGIIFIAMWCEKKWNKLQGFICGGVSMAILVVGWCCFRVGIKKFMDGIQCWLCDCAYFKLESSLFSSRNFIELFSFFKIFILSICLAYIARKIIKKDDVYERYLFIYLISILVIGCLQYFYTNNFKALTYWGWFEPIILYLFLPFSKKRKYIRQLAFIVVLYSSVFLFSSFGNVSGFGTREYWLYIPLILSTVLVFSGNAETISPKYANIFFRFGIVMLTLMMIQLGYSFVYRDESIKNLTAKVESGVWKGLYTTKERALAVVELENYIKKITEKEDKVLFRDWVSFGYLMSNGKACTPTAYDAMQYTYGVNDSKVMYDYFNLMGEVPDKIIYIDFGRDEMLSIEDDSWKFNQFVDNNYNLQYFFDREMFRILCYEISDKEKAMKMSKELIKQGGE